MDEWSVFKCKHCEEQIVRRGNGDAFVHVTGKYQVGMHTCGVSPYGFHAEPEGTACSANPANPCNGARGIEPQREEGSV